MKTMKEVRTILASNGTRIALVLAIATWMASIEGVTLMGNVGNLKMLIAAAILTVPVALLCVVGYNLIIELACIVLMELIRRKRNPEELI